MPYQAIARPLGSKVGYQMNPSVKKYTLRDVGFVETKQGNFQLVRPLDPTPQIKTGLKLKITIEKNLKTLKMSIVNEKGLKAVDIFNLNRPDADMIREKFEFYMNGMIQREIFEVVA